MPNYLKEYRKRYRRALGEAGRTAGRQGRLKDFDPREYARETGRAIYEDAQEDFDRSMRDLVSGQVNQGRVRTGYGFEDRDRYVDEWQENLPRSFAEIGQRSAGQELDAARLGQRQRERYYDLLAGGLDRETAIRNANRQRRGNLLGGLGSLAGGLAGTFLLPTIGGGVGAQMGGAIGSGLGSNL